MSLAQYEKLFREALRDTGDLAKAREICAEAKLEFIELHPACRKAMARSEVLLVETRLYTQAYQQKQVQ